MKKRPEIALEHGDLSGLSTYQAGILLSNAHRTIQKHSDAILKPFGISKTQWLIIGVILDTGDAGARITDIAKQLGTTLPYLTAAINALESKHILVRDSFSGDSRAKLVYVHPDFKPKCATIEQTMRESLRKSIYAAISAKDFRTYMRVLYQLSRLEG